eukprot:3151986-Prymnesium_polylepis.1
MVDAEHLVEQRVRRRAAAHDAQLAHAQPEAARERVARDAAVAVRYDDDGPILVRRVFRELGDAGVNVLGPHQGREGGAGLADVVAHDLVVEPCLLGRRKPHLEQVAALRASHAAAEEADEDRHAAASRAGGEPLGELLAIGRLGDATCLQMVE